MEGIPKKTRKMYRKEETKAYGILALTWDPIPPLRSNKMIVLERYSRAIEST